MRSRRLRCLLGLHDYGERQIWHKTQQVARRCKFEDCNHWDVMSVDPRPESLPPLREVEVQYLLYADVKYLTFYTRSQGRILDDEIKMHFHRLGLSDFRIVDVKVS